MNLKQQRRIDVILIGITLLAVFLNVFNIWKSGNANAYYTAAVTSMLQSFHNFFFASFDPGGYITIDKPPVTFWIQTLFAAVFGVHGWSLILPEALAGVGSVLLMYKLVKPSFGKNAARLSSLIIACTPIAVAVSRTNNIDSMLVFTLLLAAWMLFKGIRETKAAWVVGAFAMIGIGFNMKMLQAYMVVPAFYLFYLLAYKSVWKKKIAVLAAATVALAAVSLSWAVVVDTIPQADRPYIGGSKTNSVLELAFGYNGVSRLTGMNGGLGADNQKGNMPNPPQINDSGQAAQERMAPPNGVRPDGPPPNGNNTGGNAVNSNASGGNRSSGLPPGGFKPGDFKSGANKPGQMPVPGGNSMQRPGMTGGMFGTGQAGPLRLFQSELSGQASWLLPLVGFSCIALLAGIRRKKPFTVQEQETIFWLAWLVPVMGFFSAAGFFHQYYLIMLAPPIAALAGAGWIALWKHYKRKGWKKWLLPAALAATVGFELYILQPYQNQIGSGWLIGMGAAGIGITLILILAANREKIAYGATAAGLLVLLAGPAYWALTPILYGDNSVLPQAGPSGSNIGQRMGNGGGFMQSAANSKLIEYLKQNNTGIKYLFATTDANTAAPYIIATGKAVMAMGGFSGNDSVLTVDKLKQMTANQEVKYFLIPSGSDFRGGSANNELLDWIRANSTEVAAEKWQDSSSRNQMDWGESKSLYLIKQ